MHIVTDHKLNGLNERLTVTALDQPGSGGANHQYSVELFQNDEPADRWPNGIRVPTVALHIKFQNGPIQSVEGMNGVTNEALLAVLIDRMRGFQGLNPLTEGGLPARAPAPFACRENALALTYMEEALMWLQKRTRARLARGVEGTLKP